ncbi:MAG TPA: ImmA/IrrE family metallo-endopeptidase [Solirubrobacterales bacterium]|nr:ImmA/IrrE family metallo-endopeptidase [Solirubrobacterales bacterium]
MAFRRGFKSEAHELAAEVRADLGLGGLDCLQPLALVEQLAIPAIPLSDYAATIPTEVRQLCFIDRGAFSAVTVFCGNKRVIVYNDAHHPGRQTSDITHEAAHALLHHPPAPAFDPFGCRHLNEDHEEEARFLGAALLLTEEAAMDVVRRGLSEREAAANYGITPKLLRYRVNVTGAKKRVARARRSRASAV